jgi:hypothetical protein
MSSSLLRQLTGEEDDLTEGLPLLKGLLIIVDDKALLALLRDGPLPIPALVGRVGAWLLILKGPLIIVDEKELLALLRDGPLPIPALGGRVGIGVVLHDSSRISTSR